MTVRTPCACRKCMPHLYPPESHGPILGEGHVTTRFGRMIEHLYTRVYLDGQELDLCVEAYADVEGAGWVIVGREDAPGHLCEHICAATGHPEFCETVCYGHVTILREQPEKEQAS